MTWSRPSLLAASTALLLSCSTPPQGHCRRSYVVDQAAYIAVGGSSGYGYGYGWDDPSYSSGDDGYWEYTDDEGSLDPGASPDPSDPGSDPAPGNDTPSNSGDNGGGDPGSAEEALRAPSIPSPSGDACFHCALSCTVDPGTGPMIGSGASDRSESDACSAAKRAMDGWARAHSAVVTACTQYVPPTPTRAVPAIDDAGSDANADTNAEASTDAAS